MAPDTIFIDVAGSAHLFKGEAALLKDLHSRLASAQLSARAAIADTPGAAWAISHYAGIDIVPPGRAADVLGSLPVAALRLPQQASAFAKSASNELRSSLLCRALHFASVFRAMSSFASIRHWARQSKCSFL
ncbi:hypothetical protein [Nitrobacter vulgaris]|uniref:Uncharacterized protein n=1 Tax=Nitrobacter vulgaris TaxID=29421 RepID=A0A1V4HXW4_NITVU|nr:hypothetical protein [Nitrobacter vulgaris]OPH82715.1 hypothetical protein B2M20_10825 [Nitrobacter vulgaris]